MPKILIEESALDSIKRMAQEVQDQRDELLKVLLLHSERFEQCDIDTDLHWKTKSAIARCQESTKVFE
jgi:hypothetical protein